MPLTKKVILFIVSFVLLINLFPGCLFEEMFAGTTFSLNSWKIVDENGFLSLNISFSCSDTVNVNILDPDSLTKDSDFYFIGDHNVSFYLTDYRTNIISGKYDLLVYDSDNSEIYTKSFSFQAPNLDVVSCDPKWWKKDPWLGNYALLGLNMYVYNSGNIPVYPYSVSYSLDGQENTSLILPDAISPNDGDYISCFAYQDTSEGEKTLNLTLKDNLENILGSESFSVEVQENVLIEKLSWQYNGKRNRNVPKLEYLYDYYTGLERINNEDYGLYIFDPYDDEYIDILLDCIMFGFSSDNDVEKINYVSSLVQRLSYVSDSETNSLYEYPRYPLETLFDGKGDCEDKAILTASLLNNLGYEVALLRLPNHMAVGIKLGEDVLPSYDYFVDDYYFIETTTTGKPCGFIPTEYRQDTDVTTHPISKRPLLIHNWIGNTIAIFTNTERGDFVKVRLIVENLGIETANNFEVTSGFYDDFGVNRNSESILINSLDPSMKEKIILSVNIPKSYITTFKTRINLDYEIVDEKQSASTFPV